MPAVTTIDFHFNAPDQLGYACRLLRKAVASGATLVVTGSDQALAQLDLALWTFSATDFVPHCDVSAQPSILDKSPVVLSVSLQSVPHHGILLNLGAEVPAGFESFDRVIEVVSQADDDRQQARLRWKQYTRLGHSPTRYDVGNKGPGLGAIPFNGA